jgi:hypothetical protein
VVKSMFYFKYDEKKKNSQTLFDFYEKEGKNKYPSLFDVFKLGDRVKRKYKDQNGKTREYGGIVLAIGEDNLEIYWDKINGKYMPKEMDLTFTNCDKKDIFSGTKKYSPIRPE